MAVHSTGYEHLRKASAQEEYIFEFLYRAGRDAFGAVGEELVGKLKRDGDSVEIRPVHIGFGPVFPSGALHLIDREYVLDLTFFCGEIHRFEARRFELRMALESGAYATETVGARRRNFRLGRINGELVKAYLPDRLHTADDLSEHGGEAERLLIARARTNYLPEIRAFEVNRMAATAVRRVPSYRAKLLRDIPVDAIRVVVDCSGASAESLTEPVQGDELTKLLGQSQRRVFYAGVPEGETVVRSPWREPRAWMVTGEDSQSVLQSMRDLETSPNNLIVPGFDDEIIDLPRTIELERIPEDPQGLIVRVTDGPSDYDNADTCRKFKRAVVKHEFLRFAVVHHQIPQSSVREPSQTFPFGWLAASIMSRIRSPSLVHEIEKWGGKVVFVQRRCSGGFPVVARLFDTIPRAIACLTSRDNEEFRSRIAIHRAEQVEVVPFLPDDIGVFHLSGSVENSVLAHLRALGEGGPRSFCDVAFDFSECDSVCIEMDRYLVELQPLVDHLYLTNVAPNLVSSFRDIKLLPRLAKADVMDFAVHYAVSVYWPMRGENFRVRGKRHGTPDKNGILEDAANHLRRFG